MHTWPAGWPPPIHRTHTLPLSVAPVVSVHHDQTWWGSSADREIKKEKKIFTLLCDPETGQKCFCCTFANNTNAATLKYFFVFAFYLLHLTLSSYIYPIGWRKRDTVRGRMGGSARLAHSSHLLLPSPPAFCQLARSLPPSFPSLVFCLPLLLLWWISLCNCLQNTSPHLHTDT